MHIFISLFVILAVMVALVVGLTIAALALARSAGNAAEHGPMASGFAPRVGYKQLWVLIFVVSLGSIGGTGAA